MRLLLDTHSFLWYITNNPRLPRHAYDAIRDKSNEAFLSVVSVWEVLVKHKAGKLPLPEPADAYIESRRTLHRISPLDLHSADVAQILSLPDHHRDPFDRMLICQALQHDLTIVTNDEVFRHYPALMLAPG